MSNSIPWLECTRDGPIHPGESDFQFLSTRHLDDLPCRRAAISAWARHLPEEYFRRWIGQFTSSSSQQHNAALFELICHEWLKNCTIDVVPEPTASTPGLTPDFEAAFETGRFLVECAHLTDRLEEDRGTDHFWPLVRTLRTRRDLHMWISIVPVVRPRSAFATRPAVQLITSWLDELRPMAMSMGTPYQEVGAREFTFSDGVLSVWARTRSIDSQGGYKPGPLVFSVGGSAGFVPRFEVSVRQRIRDKCTKYAASSVPLVVALGTRDHYFDLSHLRQALFGSEELSVVFSDSGKHVEDRFRIGRDGLYGEDKGRNSLLAGVLWFPKIGTLSSGVWSDPAMKFVWAPNPFARKPLPFLDSLCDATEDERIWQSKQPLAQLLKLV